MREKNTSISPRRWWAKHQVHSAHVALRCSARCIDTTSNWLILPYIELSSLF